MSGCVVNGEAVPDFCGHLVAEDVAQRLATVDVQVVHYQVDGFGSRVGQRQTDCDLGELKARTIRCGKVK